MSGVEVAGLALTVLPLVVNQLDNYARGLETIKGLRRYRWELEGYSSNLSAQYAIFLNTLEILLQDVVDDEDERSRLISHPTGSGWKEASLKTAMAERLGRDYNAFTGTMAGLCFLLEELSNKLGRHTPDYSKATSIKSLGTIKFRKILSKAVYDDILKKIDTANHILRILTDQSHQLERATKTTSRRRKSLSRHRDGRRHARRLHDLLVGGQGWKCLCKEKHTVCFRLDANTLNILRGTGQASKSRFLTMLSTARNSPSDRAQWHEVEIHPETVEETVPVEFEHSAISIPNGKRKVQFASSSTTLCLETAKPASGSFTAIEDLCSTLGEFSSQSPVQFQSPFGYILSPANDARFRMRHVKSIDHDLDLRPLRDLLAGASRSSPAADPSEKLSRRDRLYLAATLAGAALQLQGNWLKQQWGTKDVFLSHDLSTATYVAGHPYLLWKVAAAQTHVEMPTSGSDRIQNKVLLPLAVALVELSLGETIASLYRAEDHASSQAQVHYNSATRALRNVYCESGSNYGDVVKECLYWSRNKGAHFEDPHFDESVYETVVSPLLKDFDYFEGVAQGK